MGKPLSPGQSVESLNPHTQGRGEVSLVTLIASVAGLNSKYFTLWSGVGADDDYYVWFNRASAGSDPAPAGVDHGVEVAIGASDTADQVAAAVKAALISAGFNVSIQDATLQITAPENGDPTNITAGDSTLSVSTVHPGTALTYSPGMSPADISNNP